jgi:hypothetical protein
LPIGLAPPALYWKTSRLNIISIPVPDQVGNIIVATVDREYKLVSNNDIIACQLEQSGVDIENINLDLPIPLMESSELLSANRFPIPVPNRSDTEEEIIMVPAPASPDFAKGLSSALEALVPTPPRVSIYSLQLRLALNTSIPRIPSPPSPSILEVPIPPAFELSTTGPLSTGPSFTAPQSPLPDTSRNQFDIEGYIRERDQKLAAK